MYDWIKMTEHSGDDAQAQIDRLATFIMDEVPGEPGQSEGEGEGAVDCAIRLIADLLAEVERHRNVNLVRAVTDYRAVDEWVTEAINAEGFDRVPWVVAGKLADENRRLEREITLRERQT